MGLTRDNCIKLEAASLVADWLESFELILTLGGVARAIAGVIIGCLVATTIVASLSLIEVDRSD